MPDFDRGLAQAPPWSETAEACLISAMLYSPDAIAAVRGRVRVEDFYREGHRRLFRAIIGLFDKGKAVDVVTVGEYLQDRGELEQVGGLAYIAEIVGVAPVDTNAVHHAEIVGQKASLRQLIEVSSASIRDAYDLGDRSVEEVLSEAEDRVLAISAGRVNSGYRRIKDRIWRTFEKIEEDQGGGENKNGIPTGIPHLDRMTAGLQPQDFTVLAARPSMGKTALALGIALEAGSHDHPVAISSLETTDTQLIRRGLASWARIDLMKIRRGELTQEEYQGLAAAAGRMHDLPVWIDDRPGGTVQDLRAKLRRVPENPRLLVVDYLQLMESEGENRTQQIGQVSRGLKAIARDFGIHVLALSQLSRRVEDRKPPRPRLSDLRDSGAIEQDADNVLLLWRPEFYFTDATKETERVKWAQKGELIIGKQRDGPTGVVGLHWDGPSTTFTELMEEGDPTLGVY